VNYFTLEIIAQREVPMREAAFYLNNQRIYPNKSSFLQGLRTCRVRTLALLNRLNPASFFSSTTN